MCKKILSWFLAFALLIGQTPAVFATEEEDILEEIKITATPEPSVEPTTIPEVTVEPTASPEVTAEHSVTPEPNADPTVTPEITAEATVTPESTVMPTPETTPSTDEEELTEMESETEEVPAVYSLDSGTCGENLTWTLADGVLITTFLKKSKTPWLGLRIDSQPRH